MKKIEDITFDDIKIQYDGEYPCLCMGHLVVTIKDKVYDFGNYVLSSGGSCGFTEDFSDSIVEEGDWYINDYNWPKDMPIVYRPMVMQKINMEIPHGCCGGCL